MAYRTKNHENLSVFSKRLWSLMITNGYDTPRKLATALYDEKLASVDSKNDPYALTEDIRKNAIGSIEKKILKHLEASKMKDVKCTGELILAYCKHLNCSTDYLFGLTDIKTDMPDIRNVCELTGLTEASIKSICRITSGKSLIVNGDFSNKAITSALNLLLEYPGLYKYLTCLCYVSESLHTVKTNELFENELNNIPKKYREAAVDLFFDAEDAVKKGIKPTKKLLDYANRLDDAAYKESTNWDIINPALKEYKSNRYDLEEKHRIMAEEIVNNLVLLLNQSSDNN